MKHTGIIQKTLACLCNYLRVDGIDFLANINAAAPIESETSVSEPQVGVCPV